MSYRGCTQSIKTAAHFRHEVDGQVPLGARTVAIERHTAASDTIVVPQLLNLFLQDGTGDALWGRVALGKGAEASVEAGWGTGDVDASKVDVSVIH